MNKKIIFTTIICIMFCLSVVANAVLGSLLIESQKNDQQKMAVQKIMQFRNLFTEKVLLSEQSIDFDTRLSLETAVRALSDQEIFSQWQEFTGSKTQEDATYQAKQLLKLLIQKTSS